MQLPSSIRSAHPIAVVMTAALFALLIWAAFEMMRVEVKTVRPVRGSAVEVVYATGTIEPKYWAKVVALQRKRIVSHCHCESQMVKKGQVLARLDDLEERAQLGELQARLDRLREDAARMKQLIERNVTSRVSYDEKLTQISEYEARIEAQKERIDDLVLRAPMDGVVLRRDGEVGEVAGIGVTDVLFWVGQTRPLRVVAEVNEDDIPRVRPGQRVLLRHDGLRDVDLIATVNEITPKGDPATKTFRVYFSLPDDTPLKIGMSVEANIIIREVQDALLIPAEAIADGMVSVVNDGRIERRKIDVGIKGTRMVEVLGGLTERNHVISPSRASLKPGTRVRIAAGNPT